MPNLRTYLNEPVAIRNDYCLLIHVADGTFYEELSNQNELIKSLDHTVENFREWATEEHVRRTASLDDID
jgi:hypothetical protein